MLVQDPPHHAQLITAMFGKLPSEPNPTLGPGDEILPEANPWAVRWMADLEELEPYDERGVIQRMGRDVRDLVLDRELAEDFVSMDVTMLRLRSLAVEVPPWDFREEAGHPMELSEEGVPQCRRCFDEQCEARTESFKALATHVLRHHRQNGGGVSIGDHKSVSSLPCGLLGQKRLIVISCRRFIVGPVVIDDVILVKYTSHCLSVAQSAQPNLENGQNSNSTSLNICETFSKMTDFEMPSWGERKPEEGRAVER